MKIALFVCVAALLGCSAGSKPEHDGGPWVFDDDAGTRDATTPDTGRPGGQTTFVLTNGHSEPVLAYHSAGSQGCSLGAFVQVLENGEFFGLADSCTECRCGEAECALCDLDCAPGAELRLIQLGVGGTRSFTWDGMLREQRVEGGQTCTASRAPSGSTLTARFCWGHGFELIAEPWGQITNLECHDVEFSVGDALVELVIPTTARDRVRLELANATNETLYASPDVGSPCLPHDWVTLRQAGEALQIQPFCGECSCNGVLDASTCPQPCPAVACAPPTAELYALPPGATRTFDWNRVAFVPGSVSGIECKWDHLVAGDVTAEFCWGTGFDDDTYTLTGSRCEPLVFDPQGATRVRHEITGP